jgi:hypothetical protein
MAGFEAKIHGSWQRGVVLKTATADKLKMRNEEVMKPLILKQGSLNLAEKPVMPCSPGKTKLLLLPLREIGILRAIIKVG